MIDMSKLHDQQLLKIKDILDLTQWSRPTFFRRRRDGKAPKMLMDGNRCLGCTVGAYKEWLKRMENNS